MKCYKPNSDQECILTVSANGFACPEYILPAQTNFASEPSDILECFIPVSDGDEITISGTFNGTVLHACFDLLADGSFVGDKHIEGAKTDGVRCYRPRKLEYKAVMNVPVPPGWTSKYSSEKVIEGPLCVKKLPENIPMVNKVLDSMSSDGEQIGVGSIAIVVCLTQSQSEDDMHENAYVSMRCGEWLEANSKGEKFIGMSNGGIVPTHELEVRISDDRVHVNKQSKHRRHFKQQKFGKQLWATFVFYYRSPMAIRMANCMARPDKYQELCDYGEQFEQVAPREKQRAKKDVNEFGSLNRITESVGEVIEEASPPPPPRRKLFGQSLFHKSEPAEKGDDSLSNNRQSIDEAAFPDERSIRSERNSVNKSPDRNDSPLGSESPDTLFVAQEPRAPEERSQPANDEQDSSDSSQEMFSNPFAGRTSDRNQQTRHQQIPSGKGGHALQKPAARAREGGSTVTSRQGSDVNASTSRQPFQTTTSNTSPSSNPALQRFVAGSAQQVRFQSESTRTPASSNNKSTMLPPRVVTQDEIRALAAEDGAISFKVLVDYCDANGIDQDLGIRRAQEIAFKSGPSWVLFDPRQAAAKAPPPLSLTNGARTNVATELKESTSQASLRSGAGVDAAVSPARPIEVAVDQALRQPLRHLDRPQGMSPAITSVPGTNITTASATPSHETLPDIKMEPHPNQPPQGRGIFPNQSPNASSSESNRSPRTGTTPINQVFQGWTSPGSPHTQGRGSLVNRAPTARMSPSNTHLQADGSSPRDSISADPRRSINQSPQAGGSPRNSVSAGPGPTVSPYFQSSTGATAKSSPKSVNLPPKPPSAAGIKRPASPTIHGTIREDTPSKRNKTETQALQDQLSAEKAKNEKKEMEKAVLRKQLEEKEARKKERKQQREKEAEAMKRELAETKKVTEEIDDELEALRAQLAAEDDEDSDMD